MDPKNGFQPPSSYPYAPAQTGHLPYPISPAPQYSQDTQFANIHPGVGTYQTGTQAPQFGPNAIPPIGFYIPPTNGQLIQQQQQPQMENTTTSDDEPKYTPGYHHDDISGFEFSDKAIRRAFIRKVYSILSLQLGVTVGFIALFLYNTELKLWTHRNPGFLFGVIGVYIVTIITLACCDGVRRKFPTNVIFLGIFTLATGVMVGVVSSTYSETSVLLAAGITTVIVIALTLFSFQTKLDFTRMNGILFTALLIFILFGFMMMFLRAYFEPLRMVYAGLGALLFSAFLVHDTQLMMGGEHKYSISPEEYVFASLNLYLDIINIFMFILQLLGRNN